MSLGIHKIKKSRYFVFFTFIIISPVFLFAASGRTDAGQSVLEASLVQSRELKSKGFLHEAINSFGETLRLARAANQKRAEVECLMSLGVLSWDKGNLGRSDEYYTEAIHRARECGFEQDRVKCETAKKIYLLYEKGSEFRLNKEYDRSKKCFLEAIRLARNIESINHECKCLRQMSIIYFDKLDLDRFYSLNHNAYLLAKNNKIIREEGYCGYNMAFYFWKTGNYLLSFEFYDRSMEISKMLHDKEDEFDCLYSLGTIFLELGDYNRSLKYYKKILVTEKSNDYLARLFNAVGIVSKRYADDFNNTGKYMEANSYYRKALNYARGCNNIVSEISILNNLATSYIAQKKYKEALAYLNISYRISKEIANLNLMSLIQSNLGRVYLETGWIGKATGYFNESIRLFSGKEETKNLWENYYGLGRCFDAMNNFGFAYRYYRKSIEITDRIKDNIYLDVEKAGYLKNKYAVYDSMIRLLFLQVQKDGQRDAGLKDKLLLYIEKSKSNITRRWPGWEKKEGNTLFVYQKLKDREISAQISSIMKYIMRPEDHIKKDLYLSRIEDLEEASMRLLSSRRSAENQARQEDGPRGIDPLQARECLGDETLVLEYFLGSELSVVAAVTRNDCHFYSLPSRVLIERSIGGYLRAISSGARKEFIGMKAAERLFKELLFPLMNEEYRAVKNIIIIPDDILFYLPFETMTFNDNNNHSPRYLIERYNVSYAPSLVALLSLLDESKNRGEQKKYLALGSPDYAHIKGLSRDGSRLRDMYLDNGFSVDPLPNTRDEATVLARIFKPGSTTLLLDDAADEARLKQMDLSKYRIIHFACHAFVDEQVPIRSALVLSLKPGSVEDGLLQAREIYDLDLEADLVVLSACQTARGVMTRGEGILGLTKTFIWAGARSVISTLWSISDDSTVLFMKYFYTYLSKGMTKNDALRRAKLRMIRSRYSHPFYWAAFILNGDFKSRCN